MSNETSAETAVDATTEAPEGDTPADSPNAEAARYRVKLREAETQRDHLQERVDTLQRAELARLATEHRMHNPEDLGLDLDDVRTESGDLDHDKITAHIEQLKADRPHYFSKPRVRDFGGGDRGTDITAPPRETSWSEALKPDRHWAS